MSSNLASPTIPLNASSGPAGVIPAQGIARMLIEGAITAAEPLVPGQVQPASLDLRLGREAWRVRASFLPGASPLAERLRAFEMHRIDGVPQRDIASELRVSPTLVNFMVRDAHNHCRARLLNGEVDGDMVPAPAGARSCAGRPGAGLSSRMCRACTGAARRCSCVALLAAHLRPGVAQADGAVEHRLAGL